MGDFWGDDGRQCRTMTDKSTQTDFFTPCACVRGNNSDYTSTSLHITNVFFRLTVTDYHYITWNKLQSKLSLLGIIYVMQYLF